MTDWPEITLAELCEKAQYGYTASASDDRDLPRFLRITDIARGPLDWRTVPGCEIEPGLLPKYRLVDNDIVVARSGSVGFAKRIRTPPEAVFASYLVRFRPKKDVDPGFIGAIVESECYRSWVLQHAGGAAQPNANAKVLGAFPLLLPPFPIQRRISGVVGALTDLIENNWRRVEVLEEMARAIYREWFVRFRYPGHENVPLVDSALGPIPDGWAVRSLGELSTNHDRRRRPLSKAQRAERRGPFPYYGAAKLIDWVDGWIFDGEHLLFAEDGTVQTADGFPVLQLVEGKFWANNHTHILEGRGVSTRFLFLACAVQPIAGYVTGAAQPKITQANLNRLALVVATPDIQRRFDEVVDPILDEWRSLQRSSAPLDALRSLLLPRLVTGQIDVSHLDLDALTGAASA